MDLEWMDQILGDGVDLPGMEEQGDFEQDFMDEYVGVDSGTDDVSQRVGDDGDAVGDEVENPERLGALQKMECFFCKGTGRVMPGSVFACNFCHGLGFK